MITQAEFDALLQRYLDGHSLPGEQQLVEKWSEQLGQEENLWLHPDLREEVRATMWHRIVQLTNDGTIPTGLPEPEVIIRPLSFWRAPALRWAAAALLVLGGVGAAWWLPQHGQVPVATAKLPAAQRVQQASANGPAVAMQLADGTHVTLYPGSTLKYKDGLAGVRREVYLTGKAFFKVTKNPARPFLVYTDKLVTTVLGTSFLVTAYANTQAKVAVCEGRVAVQAREGAELAATPTHPAAAGVLLLPNQQVIYSSTTQRLNKVLVDQPLPLTHQPLAFKNRPVMEVLAALEKTYGVNIVYDPLRLSDCTITISFGDESLFEQLDALCKALDGKYKMANNAQIIFESAGCKANKQ